MKVILFSAGRYGKRYIENAPKDQHIIAVADNNETLQREGRDICGHIIINPATIMEYDFDKIVIAVDDNTPQGQKIVADITAQLLSLGVEKSKIKLQYMEYLPSHERVKFLRSFAESLIVDREDLSSAYVNGAVAECGVFRGTFAAYINELFPDRKLYLFDTFTGFADSDFAEESITDHHFVNTSDWLNLLKNGDTDAVLMRCPYPENVIIKQGHVPESLQDVKDEKFVFVNLDMDIYKPQLEALRFFAPRMISEGVIVLHDYYSEANPGVKQAVDEFANEWQFVRIPIGDLSSVALVLKRQR